MTNSAARSAATDTSARILAVAERLAQTRGFNGFSYADIADELAITKASLHYHFASKAELGRTLILRYAEQFEASLAEIEKAADPREKILHYIQLYENVLVRDRMCLCGMLAAEYETLPNLMQRAIRRFFDNNEVWLAKTLEGGRRADALFFAGTALETARALTGALEGAMLLARAYEEPARFTVTAQRLLADLTGAHAGRAKTNARKASSRVVRGA